MFHAHPAQSALGGSAREEEKEEISNGGGGWNELVNSTIPHYAIYIYSGRRIVGCDMAQRSETAAHQRSKIVQPTKRSKIVEVTVIPMKRFALMKSYVFIDVIKETG
jgi:hypothetical protein